MPINSSLRLSKFAYFLLASAVPALREHPTLRTRRNIVCTGIAAVGAVVSGAFILAGIYAIAVSPEYWTNAQAPQLLVRQVSATA